jgi:hypothetical protein
MGVMVRDEQIVVPTPALVAAACASERKPSSRPQDAVELPHSALNVKEEDGERTQHGVE